WGPSNAAPRSGVPDVIEVKLSGRYRLEAKVADGAIGSVWHASDEVLDRSVAVKILHPHLAADDLFRERFRLEALSAARLTHPNIVAIYDTGEGQGTPFLVMEHLEGGTLRHRLDSELRMTPMQVARIGVEVCAALEHAHANGIVHADIKPSNILFTETGMAKVSDFGLAGAPPGADGAEGPGVGAGSVRYLSPEQVDGAPATPRSDLYALGLVLYEALTGHAPFAGSSDLAAAVKRQATAPARPQRVRPDVPRALDEIVVRALQPSPADRFSDAAEMRRALVALAADDGDEEGPRAAVAGPVEGEEISFVKTEGRWLLPALLAVLIVGAIAIIVIDPADIVTRITDPFRGPDAQPGGVTIQDSGAYDPGGDGGEHDGEVRFAFDGDTGTRWRTNGYRSPDFGQLKDGVGIWFDAGQPVTLNHIKVFSSAGGWQGSIRTSEDGRTWSEPAVSEQVGTEHVFVAPGSHRYWMVWITRLGTATGIGDAGNPWGVAITEIQPGTS
ncbi:MAG: protein kinase domain-containing protein, partial [Actinomycetota bacterium]